MRTAEELDSLLAWCADAIGDKIEDLKKGKSDVLEANHTLILGWSDKSLNMIDQLCLANESAGGKAIVILAERDKQDMEHEIHRHVRDLRGSRVLCRCIAAPCLAQNTARSHSSDSVCRHHPCHTLMLDDKL